MNKIQFNIGVSALLALMTLAGCNKPATVEKVTQPKEVKTSAVTTGEKQVPSKQNIKQRVPLNVYTYYYVVNARAASLAQKGPSFEDLLVFHKFTEEQIKTSKSLYKLNKPETYPMFWGLPINNINDLQFVTPEQTSRVMADFKVSKTLAEAINSARTTIEGLLRLEEDPIQKAIYEAQLSYVNTVAVGVLNLETN
jgi:hypothetical protein